MANRFHGATGIEDGRIKKAKKPRKTHVSVSERVDPDVTEFDTGDPMKGIVKNPFKDKVVIPRGKIDGDPEVYLGNIHNHIVDLLERIYQTYGRENVYILGCIAWLSDRVIVTAMAQAAGVQILVNDEDFKSWGGGKMVENLYDALPRINVPFKTIFAKCANPILACLDIEEPEPPQKSSNYFNPFTKRVSTSVNLAQYYAAIRVVGTRSISTLTPETDQIDNEDTPIEETSYKSSFQSGPILHSKYIIPCVWQPGKGFRTLGIVTGSCNYTQKSRRNQENVVWIPSEEMGNAYLHDFVRSFQVSLPLRK